MPPENSIVKSAAQQSSLPDLLQTKLDKKPFSFHTISLYSALNRITELPSDTLSDGSPKSDEIWERELPVWMLGSSIRVGANLAISLIASELQEKLSTEDNQTVHLDALLVRMVTAKARLAWEQVESEKIIHVSDKKAVIAEKRQFLSESVSQELSQSRQKIKEGVLNSELSTITTNALREVVISSRETDSIAGRTDRGFYDIIYLTGQWDQLGVREEPRFDRENPNPFIGFILMTTRNNPNTGELEFAFSLDNEVEGQSLRSTLQTSITRVPIYDGIPWTQREEGDRDWLEAVQRFLTDKRLTRGINIFATNANPSRMVRADQDGIYARSSELFVHVDMAELPEEMRESVDKLTEGKAWLNLEQIENLLTVGETGIPILTNEFATSAIGEILIKKHRQQAQLLIDTQTTQAEFNENSKFLLTELKGLLESDEINKDQALILVNSVLQTLLKSDNGKRTTTDC